ncbi:MAG: MarR family transcriptional regulator, partial [Actinomycetes bacterium]
MPTLASVPCQTTAELAGALSVIVVRLSRRMRTHQVGGSLTASQTAVLYSLERHGPLSLRDLADHEKVRPPSITRTVDALESAGLVARAAHPSDLRQVIIGLTEAA